MKYGEYIRTELGDIKQITEGFEFIIELHNKSSNKIVKHSKNIIDLIEEKDIVNGKLVYSIGTAIGNFPIVNHNDGTFTPSNMIETILTKEQYEQNSYKI